VAKQNYYDRNYDDFEEGLDTRQIDFNVDPEQEGSEQAEDSTYTKPRRGPKKGPRKKIVHCKEFEAKVIPLYVTRREPQTNINSIIKMAITMDSIVVVEGKAHPDALLTVYLQEFYPKDKTLQALFKLHKGTEFHMVADLPFEVIESLDLELKKFYEIEKKIIKVKEQFVWKCWSELEERTKGIARIIVYTKSLTYEEAENLTQDSSLYFHQLHMKYNPFFILDKTVPYLFYMLNMVRQKLRYHVQAYHIKKNKEDLKEEISDFDMSANYINSYNDDGTEHDLRSILREIEDELPSDKHRLVFEMLKDGHKQKSIAKAISYTQSWVSTIVKKKIRAAIIKKVRETGQENLLIPYGIDIDDYKDEDLDNIWEV
jgi:hypothetical protein